MRLFIAINFNDDTKNGLFALCDELRANSKRGKFSLPENLHLTLVFLGECDAKQTDAVKAIMDSTNFEPFDLTIERIGRFKRDGGDIWWAGVRESKALLDLQRNLTAALSAEGFSLDKRKYSPHITLGREIITKADHRHIKEFGETVSSIELMKSERIGGKLTYTAIYSKRAASRRPVISGQKNPQ
ncbi:MAG: RNA 2',3'-cyclic phosphodiesterase [Acidobacteriota bacterium]|jgi:2'-5' RNA ligase|nr:RNA 2',3'-cyclic phosphodiesterase [Acidobacteriota bacterium]